MIPQIQKIYYNPDLLKKNRDRSVETLRIKLLNQAKNHEEYERMVKAEKDRLDSDKDKLTNWL